MVEVEQSLIPHPNSRDRNKPMKKLQDFVLKFAQALPNAALAPPVETLLRDRLDRFVSHYTTPDHPPYSAMIQNALQELNEKGGSTKKSISQYLEKRYDNLPRAHSLLLKHHLERTSESGEIVVTRTKKYFLAGSPNLRTKVENKPRKKRKWRLECDRQKHYQLKLKFIRERNKPRGTKVEAIRKYKKHEVKEQPLTENGEDQTKSLISCVDEGLILHGNPTILQNEKKYTEEVSTQLENDASEIAKSNISEHHEREQSEHDQLDSEIANSNISEHHEREQSEHDQLEVSTPERPPGFEFVRVENLYQLASTEPEPASVGEVTAELITPPKDGEFDSLQSECNMETPTNQEQVLDLIPITAELATPSKDGEFDSLQSECNMETPTNQEQALDLIPITAELVTPSKDGGFDSLQSDCNMETPTNQEQVLDLIPTTAELVTPSKDGGFDSLQSDCNMETPTNQEQVLDLIPTTAELVTPSKDGEFDSLQSECNMETPMNQEQVLDLIPTTAELVTPSKDGEFDSLQSDCNMETPTNQEQVLDLIPITAELVTPSKDGDIDSLQSDCNMETPTNQEQVLDLIPITLKQLRHEKQFIEEDVVEVAGSISSSAELMRNGRRGWRRNNKLKKSLLQNEHVHEPSLTSKESESALSTGQEPREKQVILQGMQLRRSLRAKPRVAKDANTEEHCPVTVCRRQDTVSKQRPTKAKREESQGSSKSQKKKMILEQKPDAENQKAVDNFTQSGKLEACAPSMHENISKQKARKEHRPSARRSERLRGS